MLFREKDKFYRNLIKDKIKRLTGKPKKIDMIKLDNLLNSYDFEMYLHWKVLDATLTYLEKNEDRYSMTTRD
jgi:hypothetical protein